MRCHSQLDLGALLRETRRGQGLSQHRLAVRAGTSQDAISRLERGVEAPTLERFSQLMLAMGYQPVLNLEPLESPVPPAELAAASGMTPTERLREASSWNRVASQLAASGDRARRAKHPATRSSGE
ncbi:MAG TPA: helix-turn-helix transcriptional regulator [Solirubrobacterales bacterium]|nr:helix-turn-helix transcriptional regulator [Solirubrobacterales bacterium]